MAAAEDIDRLAEKVAHLSTKLVNEVAKALELEESILQLRKENSTLKHQVEQLAPKAEIAKDTEKKVAELQAKLATVEEEKRTAEEKNKQLEGEVEDLTASLFNEANEMVSNASRETYNFKVKNGKLHEEIEEKNAIIDSLLSQLQDLRGLFVKLEDQQRNSKHGTPQLEHGFEDQPSLGEQLDEYGFLMSQLIYAPKVRAIRFDVPYYQQDFKAFIFQLVKPEFTFDLTSLKTLKYFRKIWHEEIEPALGTIPSVTNNFLNRFSKGKTFWTLLAEGKAIIEPVSAVNETFKLSYRGVKTGEERPIAMEEPCAFCSETRGNRLEHARLHTLKLYGPASETTITGDSSTAVIGGEVHEVIGTYPLCNFCLVKLRAICEFFAKLRLVHANVYKIQQNSSFDDLAFASQFQFKKYDDRSHLHARREVSAHDEAVLIKLYFMLLTIRAKIFWSKIGFWDTEEDSETVTADEAPIELYQRMVQESAAFGSEKLEPLKRPDSVASQLARSDTIVEKEEDVEAAKEEDATEKVEDSEVQDNDHDVSGDEGDFADSEEAFQPVQRRKSKSKAFKDKIDRDLDSTMEMLKESLGDEEKDKPEGES